MLLYIQENKEKNAVGEATATVDKCVSSVGNNKRTGDVAMTFGHKLVLERKAVEKETIIIAIGKSVVILKECNISKEGALNFLNRQYSDYSDVIIVKLNELYNRFKANVSLDIIYQVSRMHTLSHCATCHMPFDILYIQIAKVNKITNIQKMYIFHTTRAIESRHVKSKRHYFTY